MAKQEKSEEQGARTLHEEELESRRVLGRRSLMSLIGVASAGAAGTALSGCIVAAPAPQSGRGGGARASGITDGDSGSCADAAGHGWGTTNLTDSDSGTCSDPAGRGRATGLTDSDSGSNADAGGRGRWGS